jgi:predicted dehydrogenase
MPPPKFAFVGDPASVSPWLLRAIAQAGVFEAICDHDAEQQIGRWHARWAFTETGEMLREAEPDGVVLSMPLSGRTPLIKQCLTAGAGVLVAGPPGAASACGRLALFAKLAGQLVMAAPAIRFSPSVLLARRLLDSGKFGPPISMALHSTHRASTAQDSPQAVPISADQVFEAADLVHHLVGPIERAFSSAHADGAMTVSAVSKDGVALAMVFHANGMADAVGIDLELRAADGTRLTIDRNGSLDCVNGSRVGACHRVALGSAEPGVELGYDGLVAEFRRHLEARRSGSGLVGAAGAVTASVEAILGSAAKGRAMIPKSSGRAGGSTATRPVKIG